MLTCGENSDILVECLEPSKGDFLDSSLGEQIQPQSRDRD